MEEKRLNLLLSCRRRSSAWRGAAAWPRAIAQARIRTAAAARSSIDPPHTTPGAPISAIKAPKTELRIPAKIQPLYAAILNERITMSPCLVPGMRQNAIFFLFVTFRGAWPAPGRRRGEGRGWGRGEEDSSSCGGGWFVGKESLPPFDARPSSLPPLMYKCLQSFKYPFPLL